MSYKRQSDKRFCQYQFWCKNVNFVQKKKKNEILREMLTFSLSTESDYLFAKCFFFFFFLEKCDFLCDGLYTITNRQILIKTISVS